MIPTEASKPTAHKNTAIHVPVAETAENRGRKKQRNIPSQSVPRSNPNDDPIVAAAALIEVKRVANNNEKKKMTLAACMNVMNVELVDGEDQEQHDMLVKKAKRVYCAMANELFDEALAQLKDKSVSAGAMAMEQRLPRVGNPAAFDDSHEHGSSAGGAVGCKNGMHNDECDEELNACNHLDYDDVASATAGTFAPPRTLGNVSIDEQAAVPAHLAGIKTTTRIVRPRARSTASKTPNPTPVPVKVAADGTTIAAVIDVPPLASATVSTNQQVPVPVPTAAYVSGHYTRGKIGKH